jgi:hypothetical protein
MNLEKIVGADDIERAFSQMTESARRFAGQHILVQGGHEKGI